MGTQKARGRIETTTKKPIVKQRVLENRLSKNKNRVPKPPKKTVPYTNQYGSSR